MNSEFWSNNRESAKKAISDLLIDKLQIENEDAGEYADFIIVMMINGKSMSELDQELVDIIGDKVLESGISQVIFNYPQQLDSKESTSNQSMMNDSFSSHVPGNESNNKSQPIDETLHNSSSQRSDETSCDISTSPVIQINPLIQKPNLTGPIRSKFNKELAKAKPSNFRENRNNSHQQQSPSHSAAASLVTNEDTSKPLCKYCEECTNIACEYAHPTPAASKGLGLVLVSQDCHFGAECTNSSCSRSHPSPALAKSKNGIPCRFSPCLNPLCLFQHFSAKAVKPVNRVWRKSQV